MNKTTTISLILWLTFVFLSTLFFAYTLAAFLHNARMLQEYEPPTQQDILEQHERQRLEYYDRLFQGIEEFEVTAYTHAAPGGDINGTGDGITASGLPVREGLVAVDPRLIPLGKRIWVEGLGVLLAADTGSLIRGNRLDVFMDDKRAAMEFGRQTLRGVVME